MTTPIPERTIKRWDAVKKTFVDAAWESIEPGDVVRIFNPDGTPKLAAGIHETMIVLDGLDRHNEITVTPATPATTEANP